MPALDARPTLSAPDDDPHLWLETIASPEVDAWVRERNGTTEAAFLDAATRADRDRLRAALDAPDKIPFVGRRGAHVYNFWQDAKNPRGLWRRSPYADWRVGAPVWDVLLDVDAINAAEAADWVWHGAETLAPGHERALVSLSPGGTDAQTVREFDLTTRRFVEGGFELPLAKGGASFLDADTLLVASAFGPDAMRTASGYARTVRLLRRGTRLDDAPVVFEGRHEDVWIYDWVDRSVTPNRVLFVRGIDFFRSEVSIGDANGPEFRLDVPEHASISVHRNHCFARLRSAWTSDGRTYPAGALLAFRLDRLAAGERHIEVVWHPEPRATLNASAIVPEGVVLGAMHDLVPRLTLARPAEGGGWTASELPGAPAFGSFYVRELDVTGDPAADEVLIGSSDTLTPATEAIMTAVTAPEIVARAPARFDASGLVITKHEAVSIDGERIPYFQAGPRDAAPDAPVLLTGYGGFEIANLPVYSSTVGLLWLEKGGTFVLASIRGGGEFGPDWHSAGRRAGKALSHDDFAAVARDLVRRGVTRHARIAGIGGSNGGLLIGNMLTRYPDHFGALVCQVPLLDMRRYTKLLAGASWVAEYGDPDDAADWAFLSGLSAYHAVEPGKSYPPILITTSRTDDRVHPGHARKTAAKLEGLGYRVHFHEPLTGGHAGGTDNKTYASAAALAYAFAARTIGLTAPGSTDAPAMR